MLELREVMGNCKVGCGGGEKKEIDRHYHLASMDR